MIFVGRFFSPSVLINRWPFRCDLDDEIIHETPDMEQLTGAITANEIDSKPTESQKRNATNQSSEETQKKQKREEAVTHYNQPSPDLFDSPSQYVDDVSIPLAQVSQKSDENHRTMVDDDGQCDDDDAMQNNIQATPPNPFTQSHDFNSEKINIEQIIAALMSQTQQTPQVQQQPDPSFEESGNDFPPNSPENRSTDESIEELLLLFGRIDKLFDEVKETS